MRVEAGFVNHPKFLRLKKAVGDYAMEAVIRIWGHCEFAQKGEFWRGADPDFVELVACWFGERGKLYTALSESKLIVVEKTGIRVNDWNHHNSRTVSNWELGRRPKRNQSQSNAQPRHIQGSAYAQPTQSRKDVRMDGRVEVDQGDNNNGCYPDGAPEGKSRGADGATVAASRTQFAALSQQIKELEAFGDELNSKERQELAKKRAELTELQKKQAAGEFH